MSLNYWDWATRYKIVNINNNRSWLVDIGVDINQFGDRVLREWGYMPNIISAYMVPEEFYEEFKTTYQGKGYLMENMDEDGGEL